MAKVILPRNNTARGYTASIQAPVPLTPRAPISLNGQSIPAPEHCESILLLEDEAQTNMILREYLESLGYKVVAVANGVDGLKEVIKSEFELVICDMMMPQLPGDMFFLAVQRTRPKLCNRFVFITGHQNNAKVDEFIQKNNAAILVKPFRLQELERTLENILSRFPKKMVDAESADAPVVASEDAPAPTPVSAPKPIPAPVSAPKPTPQPVPQPVKSVAPISQPQEKPATSMVNKALQMVGFFRKSPPPAPVNAPKPQPVAKVTPNYQDVKVTRRIAHLANAPVVETTERFMSKAKPKVTRRVSGPKTTSTAKKSDATPKVTRKLAQTGAIVRVNRDAAATPVKGGTTPKTTRKVGSVTLRVSDIKNGTATKVRVKETRKITAKIPTKTAPKVTRTVGKAKPAAKPAAKVEAPAPAPRVTRKIAMESPTPRVTRKIAMQTSAPKVTRKIEAESPAPRVTRRIAMPKISL